MKKILFLICLTVCNIVTYSQQTDDLIKKHLDAIGTEKNWLKIKTILIEGEIVSDGMVIKTTKRVIRDKAYRNDMQFISRMKEFEDGKYYITIKDNTGWKFLPDSKDKKPESLEANELLGFKEDMDYEDPFVNYTNKGTKITYVNTENFLDEDYYKFHFRHKSGKEEYIYLNANSMMISKRVLLNTDSENIKEYFDYKKTKEGIYYPMMIKSSIGDVNIKTITINPELNEGIFLPK